MKSQIEEMKGTRKETFLNSDKLFRLHRPSWDTLLRMFAANICHFGTSGFSFVEYLVNGCRYFPNILYLDTY